MRSLRLFSVSGLALAIIAGCADFEPFRNVSCFEAARLSLADAIATAERQGGQAIKAAYRQDSEFGCLQNNPGIYEVALLSGGMVRVVSVDARSGQMGPHTNAVAVGLLGEGLLEKIFVRGHVPAVNAAPAVALTISEAAELAEEDGGKAMVAWVDNNEGKPGYRVKLVENGKTRTAWVDGALDFARAKAIRLGMRRT